MDDKTCFLLCTVVIFKYDRFGKMKKNRANATTPWAELCPTSELFCTVRWERLCHAVCVARLPCEVNFDAISAFSLCEREPVSQSVSEDESKNKRNERMSDSEPQVEEGLAVCKCGSKREPERSKERARGAVDLSAARRSKRENAQARVRMLRCSSLWLACRRLT